MEYTGISAKFETLKINRGVYQLKIVVARSEYKLKTIKGTKEVN